MLSIRSIGRRRPRPCHDIPVAALAGALAGLALALLFGADLGAALAHGWESVVLPAFQTLNLSGFATCL
jgi:hypothetical protein